MSKEEALYQSLASCGAALIAFIGVCHEFVGNVLFPWGPDLFGGPIGWHTLGAFAIALGLLLLGGVLRLIEFPVVPFAVAMIALGAGIGIFAAVVHHQFHLFAVVAAAAGGVTAFFHQKAAAQRGAPAAGPASGARG